MNVIFVKPRILSYLARYYMTQNLIFVVFDTGYIGQLHIGILISILDTVQIESINCHKRVVNRLIWYGYKRCKTNPFLIHPG